MKSFKVLLMSYDPDQLYSSEEYRNLKDLCADCAYWEKYNLPGKLASLIHVSRRVQGALWFSGRVVDLR